MFGKQICYQPLLYLIPNLSNIFLSYLIIRNLKLRVVLKRIITGSYNKYFKFMNNDPYSGDGLDQGPETVQHHHGKNDYDDEDDDEAKGDQPLTRQDTYCVLSAPKDLEHSDLIAQKAALCKGITVQLKPQAKVPNVFNNKMADNVIVAITTAKDQGIVNLRIEYCTIMSSTLRRLVEFFKTSSILESFALVQTNFSDVQDFKRIVESVSYNHKIKNFTINHTVFDEDFHGKMLAKCFLESRSIKELDLSYVTFEDHKSFFEMANGLLHERCRLIVLRLKGIAFNHLEGKIMQYILIKNKSLQTLDLSQCSTDAPENLEYVFLKFDQFCNIRNLIAENLDADFNYFVESFGDAIGLNTKIESLSLKENKLKAAQYCNFWALMTPNRSLKKINVSKTEITDKVCLKISSYLREPDLRLHEINLSKNQISGDGLVALAQAIMENKSLTTLNLGQNFIREGGMIEFVQALKYNTSLQDLCMNSNRINNSGLEVFSGFLSHNSTLQNLDIGKNSFTDSGFIKFAIELGNNKGIENLNLSRNKDISDEMGLKKLAEALTSNNTLSFIDLTGLKIRKPCLVNYFKPALQQNITLKRIMGKVPSGIITQDLKDNITIESDISLKFKKLTKDNRRELNKLPLHKIDGDHTILNLSSMGNDLLIPSLKFIRYKKIMDVDLTKMQLDDSHVELLAKYLEENPNLRSLAIAENYFTDDGFQKIIKALRKNTFLNHLNIEDCTQLSSQSLRELEKTITELNMSLYSIQIAEDAGFDEELIDRINNQAKQNKAIQEHLQPNRIETSEGLVEIQFNPTAPIAKHFAAAIKSWRIMKPTLIRVVNEGLNDSHVEQLCKFLSNRNLIQSLNLRRNKIGNKGAKDLADYIRLYDKTLTSLELERNQIDDEGGEALLLSLQSNMRFECCKMSYGNPMRQKIGRQIEREIKANIQIKSTVLPRYKANNNSLVNYEESDRGPDFVRCALKSCELFRILHLSLPDNMIGEKEMNDIAYVLQRNTPLKTLNLSDNVVDAKAAKILANALGHNSHLRELDLRDNKLGDAGFAVLLEPFILQKIIKYRNYVKLDNSGNEKKNKKNMLVSKTFVRIEEEFSSLASKKLKMKVEKLLIDNNDQTEEGLKHIYTALLANQDIQIQVNMPPSRSCDHVLDDDSLSEEELQSHRSDKTKDMIKPLEEVLNGKSINILIKEFNQIIEKWSAYINPISNAQIKTIEACGMKGIKDAGVKHAIFGLAVTMVSTGNLSQTELVRQLKVTDVEPYFEIQADSKFQVIIDGIKEWIIAYNAAGEKVQEFLKSLEKIPNRANDIAAAAQEEMTGVDLNPNDIEKAIQDTKQCVTEILKVHESLVAQINKITIEIDEIQDASETLALSIDDGSILAHGKSARKKNLVQVFQCYKLAYRDQDPIQQSKMKDIADENDESKLLVPHQHEDEEEFRKQKVPSICKMSVCRPCRQVCYRDKRKPKKQCTQIFCKSYLKARRQATMFKMTLQFLQKSEQGTQKTIFAFILCQFALFFVLCMVLPFVIRSDECTSIAPLPVYAGLGLFMILSSLFEITCFFKLKSELREDDKSNLVCSSFLLVKWFQGQLASLSSGLQICFLASVAACHWDDSAEQLELEAIAATNEVLDGLNQQQSMVESGLGVFLAVCGALILIVSNFQKVKYISVYIQPQPHIYLIMPNTVRNAKLAWLCNFKLLAVVLESTSLTEYMIEIGRPIIPGKEKYFTEEQFGAISESIQEPIMSHRLKLQDLPMSLVLTVFLLGSLSTASPMEIIILLTYLGVTCLQALFCYIAKHWVRELKHVDYKFVQKFILDRVQKHNQRKAQSGDEDLSGDSVKSDGLEQFNEQLSALNRSNEQSGLEDTQKALIFNTLDERKHSKSPQNETGNIDFTQVAQVNNVKLE